MPYNSHENLTEHKIPFVRSEVKQTRNKEQKWQYFLLAMVVLLTPRRALPLLWMWMGQHQLVGQRYN